MLRRWRHRTRVWMRMRLGMRRVLGMFFLVLRHTGDLHALASASASRESQGPRCPEGGQPEAQICTPSLGDFGPAPLNAPRDACGRMLTTPTLSRSNSLRLFIPRKGPTSPRVEGCHPSTRALRPRHPSPLGFAVHIRFGERSVRPADRSSERSRGSLAGQFACAPTRAP